MLKFFAHPEQDFPDCLSDESKQRGTARCICFPETEEDVREAVRYAVAEGLSITVQGGLTGISGGAVPQDGLVVNLSRMTRIAGAGYDEATQRYTLLVQPGVLLEEVERALHSLDFDTEDWSGESRAVLERMRGDRRQFFSPDPTERSASVGGMVATNASGARSFWYGSIRSYVRALHVVCGAGLLVLKRGQQRVEGGWFCVETVGGEQVTGRLPEVHQPRVNKTAAGYYVRQDMDLVDLFVGAEGTLGIVTQIEIELLPEPEVVWGVLAFLPGEEAALDFVSEVRGEGGTGSQRPAAIEFFDAGALELLRQQRAAGNFAELPELDESCHTAVYTEYHGDCEDAACGAVMAMCEVLEACGGSADDAWVADTPHERERLRLFRHAVPESVNAIIAERKKSYPDLTKLGTDMAVPDERLKAVFAMYRADLAAAGLEHLIFGHVGNNHVHVNILPRSPDEYVLGKELYLKWARQVVAWGGTVSAEHGIGKLKVAFLQLMYSPEELAALRGVKALFDPQGLFNPGTLFGAADGK